MKRFEVRVAEGVRLGVVRSAGRLFVRGEVAVVGEGEAGLEEWRGCELLEVREEKRRKGGKARKEGALPVRPTEEEGDGVVAEAGE